MATVYFFLGAFMILAFFIQSRPHSPICRAIRQRYGSRQSALVFGFLTGVNFCPPFLAAASRVLGGGNAFTGTVYFLFFYIGTSVFLLPLLGHPAVEEAHGRHSDGCPNHPGAARRLFRDIPRRSGMASVIPGARPYKW